MAKGKDIILGVYKYAQKVVSAFVSSSSKERFVVTADNVLTIPEVWQCVNVLAQSIASLPIDLYEKTIEGGLEKRRRVTDDPRYDLMKNTPNPESTSYEFWFWNLCNLTTRNWSANLIIKNGDGTVDSIWQLDCAKVKPVRDKETYELFWEVQTLKETISVPPENMLVFKSFYNNGLLGTSLVEYAKDSLADAKDIANYTKKYFNSAFTPTGQIQSQMTIAKESLDEVREKWSELVANIKQDGTLILPFGVEYKPFTLSNQSAQTIEIRKFMRSVVAGYFRVPAHLINDLEKSTFSNIEHLDLGFVKHTLRPISRLICQRMNMTLLSVEERRRMYFEHNFDDMLKGDIESRFKAYGVGIQNAFMTRNEARRRENWDEMNGADTLVGNGTLTPIETSKTENENEKISV